MRARSLGQGAPTLNKTTTTTAAFIADQKENATPSAATISLQPNRRRKQKTAPRWGRFSKSRGCFN